MSEELKIRNKNILFICRKYFGYESEIIKSLQNGNNKVLHLIDVPFNSNIVKACIRFFPNLFFKKSAIKYNNFINNSTIRNFDIVFVIIGETVSPSFISELKNKNPNAKFILYIWDSIENNRKNIINRLKLYDKTFCFQKEDCLKYNLIFLPLFYIDVYKKLPSLSQSKEIDLCFIGTAHADRPKIIQNLIDQIGNHRKVFAFLYLQANWLFWVYKIFYPPYKNVKKELINFNKLNKEEISQIYNNSKIILDIQHPKQTGLTIRTFEVLASSTKLVTTNKDIMNYDFYNKNQICIIDRKNPKIPASFFEINNYILNPTLINNYSLNNWLNKIFSYD